MYDRYYIGKSADDISVGKSTAPYTRVVVTDADGNEHIAGDNTGQTLSFEMPWGNQEIAQRILSKFSGLVYQPYSSDGAHIPAEAGLGDVLSTAIVKGGIFSQRTDYGPFMVSSVSSPQNDEEDEEYPYVSKVQRENRRMSGAIGGLKRDQEEQKGFNLDITGKYESLSGGLQSIGEELDDYKSVTTTVFARIDDEIGTIDASLTQTVSRVGEVETATSSLGTRMGAAEAALEQQATRMDGMEEATTALTTRVGAAEAGLSQAATKTQVTDLSGRVTTVETATSSLGTRVGTAEISLTQVAKRVGDVEEANTALSSRVGEAEASLTLKANQSTVNGLSQSVATLQADVVNINAKWTDVSGTLNTDRSIIANGTVRANGGLSSTSLVLDTESLSIAQKNYTPQTITLISGSATVLGY